MRARVAWWAATAIVCAAFASVTLTTYPRAWSGHQVLHAPRDNVAYVLSQRFADGHGFRQPLRHYEDLPRDVARALTPRDAAEVGGVVVPKDFAGTMLVYGALSWLGTPLMMLAGPLFGLLSGLALAALAREIRGVAPGRADVATTAAGTLAALAWLSYAPVLVHSSYIATADLLGTAAMLMGARAFVRTWRTSSPRAFASMTAWLGLAVVMRYPNLALAAPMGIALIAGLRVRAREAILGASVATAMAAVILGFNAALYGDAMTTGYAIGNEILRESANVTGESFPAFKPDVAGSYVRYYLWRYPMLLLPLVAGIAATIRHAVLRRPDRAPAAALAVSMTAGLALYIGHDAWGWTGPVVNASVLRYLLPATAIGVAFAVAALIGSGRRHIAAATAVVALAASLSGWTAAAAPSGLPAARIAHDWLAKMRGQVLTLTDPDGIVATARLDRVLFPERQTLTLTYAAANHRPIDIGKMREWDVLPTPERFADVAETIAARGIPFYVMVDFPFEVLASYREAVEGRGFALARVHPDVPRLYELGVPS